MNKNHKKVCRVLNYTEHLLNLVSTVIGYVFISTYSSLVGIAVWITISAVGLKICVITAAVLKKYKSIVKKNENKNDKKSVLSKKLS